MVVEINLATHGSELKSAYKAVLDQNDPCNWIVLGYDKGTNDLKVSAQGDGDLDDLVEEFEDDKVLYAFAKVEDPNTQLPKFIFISWCGESAPVKRKGLLGNHLTDVQNFLKGYHIQINGRDQEDVSPQQIMKKLDESSGAKYSYHEQTRSSTISQKPPTPARAPVSASNNYTRSVSQTPKPNVAPAAPKKPVVSSTSSKLQDRFLSQVEQSDKEKQEREEQERFEKEFREKANVGQTSSQSNYGGARRTNSEALEREERLLKQQMEKARASRQQAGNNSNFEDKQSVQAEEANRQKEEEARLKREEEAERKRQEANELQRQRDLESQRQAEIEEQRRTQEEEAAASERRRQERESAEAERRRQEEEEEARADEERHRLEAQRLDEEHKRQEELLRKEEAEAEAHRIQEEERKLEEARMLELAANEAKELTYNPEVNATEEGSDVNAIALFEYQVADEGEIDMREGELITNIVQLDEGWWQGTNEAGVTGVFPANYVEIVPAAAPAQDEPEYQQESNEAVPNDTAHAVAVYDYEATEEGELNFEATDVITNIEFVSDDWWSGTNPSGETGLFPANYVELQQ